MKFVGVKGTLPCIDGWKLSISALLGLWSDVSQEVDFKFLLTARFNQDCLENFFLLSGRLVSAEITQHLISFLRLSTMQW